MNKKTFLLYTLIAIAMGVKGQSSHVISNIPNGWTVNGQTPVDGKVSVADGARVTITPSTGANLKSIKAERTVYYWGYIPVDDDAITVTNDYYPNGEFKGLASVTVNNTSFLSSSTGCPIPIEPGVTIQNVGIDTDIILFVPTKYSDGDSPLGFKDNSYNTFNMYPASFQISPLTFPYRTTTRINGQTYYALLIQNQFDGASYVFYQQQ